MIEIVFPAILSCSQANFLIQRVKTKPIDPKIKEELIIEIKKVSPNTCKYG